MIQVSNSAARQVRLLKERDKLAMDEFLRVSVKEGGCSGFSYKLDFDKTRKDNDKILNAMECSWLWTLKVCFILWA